MSETIFHQWKGIRMRHAKHLATALFALSLLLTSAPSQAQIVLPASGIINTIGGNGSSGYSGNTGQALSAELSNPTGVAVDSSGNVYIADAGNNVIRKITASTGIITTVAGGGWFAPGYGVGDGGPATSAMLLSPQAVAVDAQSNIYIADTDQNRVRKVTASTGIITTVAGAGIAGSGGDNGLAVNAYLNMPWGVAVDSTGNIFIADFQNNYVRKVTASTGIISAYAGYSYTATIPNPGGYSGNNVIATSAELYAPVGLAVDSSNNLYIADSGNQRIREVIALTGKISDVAGYSVNPGYSGDGGSPTSALLSDPMGVAVDSAGNIYVADSGNNRIREILAFNQKIYTIAGNGTAGFSGDGGPATSAEFGLSGHTGVYGIALDSHKNLYFPDANNQRIRAVGASTVVLASCSPNDIGYGQGTTCSASILSSNPTGTVAWTINGSAWGTDTLPTNSISGLTTESVGTYTISAAYSGDTNNAAGSASTTLIIETYAQTITFTAPTSPVTYGVAPITLSATATSGLSVTFSIVSGPGTVSGNTLTVTGPGTIVVAANQAGNSSYAPAPQVTRSVVVNYAIPAHGIITTIAGNGTAGYTGDGSLAGNAELNTPFDIASDSSGNVYIADANNNVIRKLTASTGNISTVAGSGLGGDGVAADPYGNFFVANTGYNRVLVGIPGSSGYSIYLWAGNINGTAGYSGDGGTAPNALLHGPQGVAVDSSDNVYIADTTNNRIRKVTYSTDIISTIAGNGTAGYTGDGNTATSAELNNPYGVAMDTSGNIYIADTYNNRIRKVTTSTGKISTIAGNGTAGFLGDNGAATGAEVYLPTGVAVDASGNVYIADYGNNRVRKVTVSTGVISTVAGNGTGGFAGDNGSATSAKLYRPAGVALDSSGNLYIADAYNNRVRVVGH
jgi:sugar lactone lactonase YvrE